MFPALTLDNVSSTNSYCSSYKLKSFTTQTHYRLVQAQLMLPHAVRSIGKLLCPPTPHPHPTLLTGNIQTHLASVLHL